MKWQLKIKASAMQFAILVSAIVAILLSSFLLLIHTYKSFSVQSNQVLKNIEYANKGITYLFNSENKIVDSVKIEFDGTPVTLSSTYWGSFEKVSSTAGVGSKTFKKAALLGSNFKGRTTGIYLEDNQLPLVLVGNTRIEGEAFIPGNIVKPGSIAGHYYYGEKLIYGKSTGSGQKLPGLDKDWRAYVKNMLHFIPGREKILIDLENISNSFFKEHKVIYQTGKIYLDKEINGNVIIKSELEIEVSRFAKLDQVLLIAPKIVFREKFEGSVHVIAEEVEVEGNSEFIYPSSIIVLKGEENESTNTNKPSIEIGTNTFFQGNLMFLNPLGNKNTTTHLLLHENTFIEGTVYCEGYTELRGTVLGGLYSKYFVANQLGSLYINHIYNGKVLTAGSKPESCGILLEREKKNVALWLF